MSYMFYRGMDAARRVNDLRAHIKRNVLSPKDFARLNAMVDTNVEMVKESINYYKGGSTGEYPDQEAVYVAYLEAQLNIDGWKPKY
jgi:hypothetical protein